MNNMTRNYASSRSGSSVLVTKALSPDMWANINFLAQAIVSPKNKQVKYYELLSRVESQSGEDIASEDFFSDLSDELIIEIATNQISYIRELNLDKSCSINTTLSSILNDHFYTFIKNNSNVNYVLEINNFEIENHAQLELATKRLSSIRELGVEIWLDDFLHTNKKITNTIGKVHWDRIKIDRSYLTHNYIFTHDLKSLLNALSPFTHKGFILEGVELEIHADFAKTNDILGQGYYYSYPQTLEKIRYYANQITKRLTNDKSQANFNISSYS